MLKFSTPTPKPNYNSGTLSENTPFIDTIKCLFTFNVSVLYLIIVGVILSDHKIIDIAFTSSPGVSLVRVPFPLSRL